MVPSSYPLVSADGHVNEAEAMWERVPEQHRALARTKFEKRNDGIVMSLQGAKVFLPKLDREMTDGEKMREFRNDPTGGADLERRWHRDLRGPVGKGGCRPRNDGQQPRCAERVGRGTDSTHHFTSFQYAAFRRHAITKKAARNSSTQTPTRTR